MISKFDIETQVLFFDFSPKYITQLSRWRTKYYIEKIQEVTIHRIENVFYPKKFIHFYYSAFKIKVLKYFKKVYNRFRPEVIHAHTFFGMIAAYIIHEEYNIPWIATEHSSGFAAEKGLGKAEIRLYKKVISTSSNYFAVSRYLKDHIENVLAINNVNILSNYIDPDEYYYSPKSHVDAKMKYIFVGELKRSKGIFDLIEAFYRYTKKHNKDELIVIGRGNAKDQVTRKIKQWKMDKNISLLGPKDHSSIPDLLRSCDCFVLPSHKETFSLATIEALACGLPCIASDCGGPKEYFDHSMGYIFPVGDIEALEHSFHKMKDNIDQFDSKAISQKILSRYSADQIVPRLKEIYNKLI